MLFLCATQRRVAFTLADRHIRSYRRIGLLNGRSFVLPRLESLSGGRSNRFGHILGLHRGLLLRCDIDKTLEFKVRTNRDGRGPESRLSGFSSVEILHRRDPAAVFGFTKVADTDDDRLVLTQRRRLVDHIRGDRLLTGGLRHVGLDCRKRNQVSPFRPVQP